MADLTPLGFNPAEVEHIDSGFTIIPPGIYPVVIVESDVRDTKANNGSKMLVLKYQIIEGQFMGEFVVDRLNIVHRTSAQAQKIGQSQLKDICDAVGFAGVLTNSELIHGKPLSVKVGVSEFKSNKSDKNLQSNDVLQRMPRQPLQVNPVAAKSEPAAATGGATPAAMPWS